VQDLNTQLVSGDLSSPLNLEEGDVQPAEKPALGRHVHLSGKMEGLGFRESQWLLESRGKFIQVTELLYRIAEQADGNHTLKQIAALVSDSTEWSLEAQDVNYLIKSKLVALGLMQDEVIPESSASSSPLKLNLQFRALAPRFIEPITYVLRWLCHPVIVVPVLVSSALARWWLYRVHGIIPGIQDAIYTPGGILFVLALVLLAAVFHEFGHAAALRHHGGRVGNMGLGLYVVSPALYTDVSDNYRLSRWARVCTDLGGIYFHLLCSVFLFVAYLATRREMLLFSLFLIDLEILEQFIPFVRLDGYWLLCDLTGIPDLFSQMVPFLRSLLPPPFEAILNKATNGPATGQKLPEMKTWVKAVFCAYILVTVPILVYVFARMILSLPDLVSQAESGVRLQIELLRQIDVRRDPFTTALLILQIVLLIAPVPATIYFLWITIKAPLQQFVDWASRTPRNAIAGGLATVACCGVLAGFVAQPVIPRFHGSNDPSRRGRQLIDESEQATANLNSMTADLEGSIGEDHYTGKMILKRPNLARVEINGSKGLGRIFMISDGKTVTTYFPDNNEFVQVQAGQHGEFIQSTLVQQVQQFFTPEAIDANLQLQYMGQRSLDGMEFDVVQAKGKSPTGEMVNHFISRSDKLIYRDEETSDPGDGRRTWVVLKDVKTNPDIDGSAFSWKLPGKAVPVQLPTGIQLPVKE